MSRVNGSRPIYSVELGRIVCGLNEGFGVLVTRIVARMRAELPEYAALEGPDLERLIAGVERVTRLFIALIAAQRRLAAKDLAAIEAVGGERAEIGVPLFAVRQSFVIAMDEARLYVEGLLRALPVTKRSRELGFALSGWFQQTLVDGTDALGRGFADRTDLASTGVAEAVQLVTTLVTGAFNSPEELSDLASRVGYRVDGPSGLVVLGPWRDPGRFRSIRAARADSLAALRGALAGSGVGSRDPYAVILIPAPTPEAWRRATARIAAIAVQRKVVVLGAKPVDDLTETRNLAEIRRRFEDAVEIVGVVGMLSPAPGLVVGNRYVIHAGLAALPDTCLRREVDRIEAALLPLPRKDLLELLDAVEVFFQMQCKRTSVASVLHIDPKTLNRRFDRLLELTDRDPCKGELALWFQLVARHLRLILAQEEYGMSHGPENGRR